ncbi:MAG: PEGA domain-containing protein [Chitinophagaceae bacterium]
MKKLLNTSVFSLAFLLINTSFSTPKVIAHYRVITVNPDGSEKVSVTTDPQTARIYVNGVLTGTGSIVVTVGKNDCVRLEVKQEGYIQEVRTYCDKKGMTKPPNSDYIQLQADESYTSSIQSDVANNEILLSVRKGKSRDEAWKTIVQTVLSKFDVLENNDERSGYLRTAWVGVVFARSNNTIRTRAIIKLSSEEPLAFKIKLISEESGRAGTSFSSDEQFKPFGRILKKYDGFIDELNTKLAN